MLIVFMQALLIVVPNNDIYSWFPESVLLAISANCIFMSACLQAFVRMFSIKGVDFAVALEAEV